MKKSSKREDGEKKVVKCCVMNCQAEIPIDKAIKVGNNYFCRLCGVAYYRRSLNL